ncbi:hypothetical protein [Priestia megaterium]|uniref:hypothetical protein n=1 Tax=Priestia megaterium TaxID=1404 RepID=UPI0013F44BF3|nr:hypothetical protein [Priestia megaterium]MED3976773.1 hypothetical protein [Priestia megaterium]MED4181522.1 hypothetical protein [Priestia megaterium]MEE3897579.1 hypothetical protein [Priestia megaterium]NGY82205.1 hypothetical protein [Priestia megaterium]
MLYKVYDALNTSDLIKEKVGKQIKFYKYPSTDNMQGVYIVIDPIDVPKPGDYADNKWLTDEYFYQIEVWSMNLFDTQAVAKEVRNIMWNQLGFAQLIPGLDEFDEDTGIYRDARRYRGKEYVEI